MTHRTTAAGDAGRQIWIDLDNSPHVPFFVPIIDELRRRGHAVVLTSRDNAQVNELVALHGLDTVQIGHHFGKHKAAKVLGTLKRSLRLAMLMRRFAPDLALSHGSRSQMVAAAWLGVPSALLFDYEFATPGVGRPTWIVTPEVIPPGATGRNPKYALRYPGIKEDVYVSRFRPDPALRARLGLADSDLVVVIRPPASEAHYHNPLSDGLLTTTIDHVLSHPSARIVLLPRTKNQDVALRERWAGLLAQGRLVIPPQAVDGLSLIWSADLVVSGGGTMNREAAALGVPVYSIFRGQLGAVDRYLAAEGRLVLVESDEDVRRNVRLVPRPATPPPSSTPRPALAAIVQHIATILDAEPAANAARPRASRRALESV